MPRVYDPPLERSFEDDPGDHFVAHVQTPTGPRERHYVDVNIHGEELQRSVLASVKAPLRRQTAARSRRAHPGGLRIGYSFWGFLGDHKLSPEGERLSTPDGNATYSWSVVWEAQRRGHLVIPMMPDRDEPAAREYGYDNFAAFAQTFRVPAYSHLVQNRETFDSDIGFPELDVLLLEWRFPIPGRNVGLDRNSPDYQPDLDRQWRLIDHYRNTDTKIIAWDLDLKLTGDEEGEGFLDAVIETSVAPTAVHTPRVRVEPPVLVECLQEHPTERATYLLSYIGSRYERDDVIDAWIRPIANRDEARGQVHFYGNWLKDPEVHVRWPGVSFHDRVTTSDFRRILRSAAGVPLLAKEEYRRRGFITPRVWEALMFGSVPIGLAGHTGISQYTEQVARDADHLLMIARELRELSVRERAIVRDRAIERIGFMDARYFVDTLESLV